MRSVFSLVFRGFHGDKFVVEILTALPGGAFGAMLVVMALMFVMGFFLDFIEIIFVVVPIVGPVLLRMDISPVWFGVLLMVLLETALITPPIGINLFVVQSIRSGGELKDVMLGALPFVLTMFAMIALLIAFPQLALWLPSLFY